MPIISPLISYLINSFTTFDWILLVLIIFLGAVMVWLIGMAYRSLYL